MEDTGADRKSNASIASIAENAVDGTNAPVASRASKGGRRTTRSTSKHVAGESKQNASKTTNKSDDVMAVKDVSTQSVRTRSKKGSEVDDGVGRTILQRTTRSKKDAENLSAGKELPLKRGPGRSSKRVQEEETIEGSSTAATRLIAKSSSAKADASSSRLRSSKRTRAKK
jgi:hypothetical protein